MYRYRAIVLEGFIRKGVQSIILNIATQDYHTHIPFPDLVYKSLFQVSHQAQPNYHQQ
jgi:hypothetical protein